MRKGSAGLASVVFLLSFSLGLLGCGNDAEAPRVNPYADVTNGLYASYNCDGNTADSTGTDNGTTSGGFGYSTDRFGNSNGAWSFNGTDAKVTAGAMSLGTTGFTVSFWEISDNTAPFTGSLIFGTFMFSFNYLDNFGFTMAPGATNTASGAIVYNSWTHVVGTYDCVTDNICFYKNGVLENSVIKGGAISNISLSSVDFGHNAWPNNSYFKGSMDDIRFYNRVLTDNEVNQLYSYQSFR